MEKTYYAIVTDKFEEGAKPFTWEMDARNKTEFKEYARQNGYSVRYNEVYDINEWEKLDEGQAVTKRQYENAYALGFKKDYYESKMKK